MRTSANLVPGAILGGRFQLERILTRTAHTVTFRALDAPAQRPVAVEVTSSAVPPDFAGFLESAFGHLASLPAHPGRVAVLGFGIDPATRAGFVASELVEGPTLHELAASPRAGTPPPGGAPVSGLEPRHAVWLALQLLDACDGRSVPPPDEVRVVRDAQGLDRVRIPLVRGQLGSYMGFSGVSGGMGEVAFLSPEQLDNAAGADEKSAVYGVGATLFFLLTGRRPFSAQTTRSFILKILNEPAVAPSTVKPGIPPFVDALVLDALAKDPKKRPTLAAYRERIAALFG